MKLPPYSRTLVRWIIAKRLAHVRGPLPVERPTWDEIHGRRVEGQTARIDGLKDQGRIER